jgi:hypothetical protein
MQFEVQAHALLPQILYSAGFLMVLFFSRGKRDLLGLLLVCSFCVTLGLRDITSMSWDADPVIYAFVLSYSGDVSTLLGGADYAIFSILHSITGAFFDLAGCFLVLHLLYIPLLIILYSTLKQFKGVFFLLVGWMIFVNSGLLLLANFFRQGLSVIVFLSLLVVLCLSPTRLKKVATLILPLLHMGSIALIPCLLVCRKRRYFAISAAIFIAFCTAIHVAPSGSAFQSDYFTSNANAGLHQTQLWLKVATIYVMLGAGYWLSLRPVLRSDQAQRLQHAAVGLLIPTGALLLTSGAPIIGLRFLYYSYAVAFLYFALVVVCRGSEPLFKLSAIGICMFGIVTWTYPSVAVLLMW